MIPDDAQLPTEVWRAFRKDVSAGITDPILLASRHGVSQERADRMAREMAYVPPKARKSFPARNKWGRR